MMSSDQRQKHLQKVWSMQCTPFEANTASAATSGNMLICIHLSIPAGRLGITTLSFELLERTWNKGENLLNATKSIRVAPGMQDTMCIVSKSGSLTSFVTQRRETLPAMKLAWHGNHNSYMLSCPGGC